MPKLVKNHEIHENTWHVASQDSTLSEGMWLLGLEQYLAQREANNPNLANLGIILPGDTDPESLSGMPLDVAVIAIDFPAFTDGRGFSLARSLREYFDYSGEIRATGYFLLDQVFYLSRCGFNAFEIGDDANIETFLNALDTFSVKYQAAIDEPQPLFRRRS